MIRTQTYSIFFSFISLFYSDEEAIIIGERKEVIEI